MKNSGNYISLKHYNSSLSNHFVCRSGSSMHGDLKMSDKELREVASIQFSDGTKLTSINDISNIVTNNLSETTLTTGSDISVNNMNVSGHALFQSDVSINGQLQIGTGTLILTQDSLIATNGFSIGTSGLGEVNIVGNLNVSGGVNTSTGTVITTYDSSAIDISINAIENRLIVIDNSINNINTSGVAFDSTQLDTSVNILETSFNNLVLPGAFDSTQLDTSVNSLETSVTNLDASVNVLETSFNNLVIPDAFDSTQLDTSVNILETSVTNLNTSVTNLEVSFNNLVIPDAFDSTQLDTSVNILETSVTNLDTSVTDLSTNTLRTSGGTMTGVINMGSNKITNVSDPTNNQDTVTKIYVDDISSNIHSKFDTKFDINGGLITGDVSINSKLQVGSTDNSYNVKIFGDVSVLGMLQIGYGTVKITQESFSVGNKFEIPSDETSAINLSSDVSLGNINVNGDMSIQGHTYSDSSINSLIGFYHNNSILPTKSYVDTQITNVNTTINDLSTNHYALDSTVTTLSTSLTDLSTNHYTLDNTVTTLSSSVTDLSTNHYELDNTVTTLSSSVNNFQTNISTLDTSINVLEASFNNLSLSESIDTTQIDSSINNLETLLSNLDSSVSIKNSLTKIITYLTAVDETYTIIGSDGNEITFDNSGATADISQTYFTGIKDAILKIITYLTAFDETYIMFGTDGNEITFDNVGATADISNVI